MSDDVEVPMWAVTVEIPMSLSGEVKDSLATAVADAAHGWEPEDRDGWDGHVTGGPAVTYVNEALAADALIRAIEARGLDELLPTDPTFSAMHKGLSGYVKQQNPGWSLDQVLAIVGRVIRSVSTVSGEAKAITEPSYIIPADAENRIREYIREALDVDGALRKAWPRIERMLHAFPAVPAFSPAEVAAADVLTHLTEEMGLYPNSTTEKEKK